MGHEQGGVRPALIVSDDKFNLGPAGLIIVVPTTTKYRPGLDKTRVQITPPDGGLPEISYAIPEQVRTISKDRLLTRYGRLSAEKIARVEDLLRVMLNL